MLRRLEQLFAGSGLDDLTVFHHEHLVRHGPDHVHIMCDEQIAQAPLSLQALQQAKNLFLDGHIERAGWFIEYQDVWLDDQGSGNRQALALATRKFMRVASQQCSFVPIQGHADIAQCRQNKLSPCLHAQPGLMNQQALPDDFFNCQTRRQRRERILKHHLHHAPHALVLLCVHAPGARPDLQLTRARQQTQQSQRQG